MLPSRLVMLALLLSALTALGSANRAWADLIGSTRLVDDFAIAATKPIGARGNLICGTPKAKQVRRTGRHT